MRKKRAKAEQPTDQPEAISTPVPIEAPAEAAPAVQEGPCVSLQADPDHKVLEAIQSAMQAVAAAARPDLECLRAHYSRQSGGILMTWERSIGSADIAIGKPLTFFADRPITEAVAEAWAEAVEPRKF